MKAMVGGRCQIEWRLRRRGRWVQPGPSQRSVGTIHSVEDNLPLIMLDEDNQPNEKFISLSPFPNPDCDYFDVTLIPPKISTRSIKRQREGDHAPDKDTKPQELAQAFLDVSKNAKVTFAVAAGDGLRIPKSIPATVSCLVPPLWAIRKANGEDPANLELEWTKAFNAFKDHFGAVFRLDVHRSAYALAVQNTVQRIYTPTAPQSKEAWKSWFYNSFQAVHEVITVTHGQKAADRVVKKPKEGFESNLVDVKDAIRLAEEEEKATAVPNAPQQAPSSDLRSVQQQIATIAATTADLVKQIKEHVPSGSFRGRGRGRGRGQF